MNQKFLRLSRTISHALRHEPWLYELELDEEGWVELEALLLALRTHRSEWCRLTERDIQELIIAAHKQRFELSKGRIRALYGHSTVNRLRKAPAPPPAILFHGTSPEVVPTILVEGLRPMNRQYVHLSVDWETAVQVGKRKSGEPTILEIAAAGANADGIAFYEGNEQVWLADLIPAAYLREGRKGRHWALSTWAIG